MAVIKRDSYQHTYADYLEWSRTHGDEVIDGTAYVREPPFRTHGKSMREGYVAPRTGSRKCSRQVRPATTRL